MQKLLKNTLSELIRDQNKPHCAGSDPGLREDQRVQHSLGDNQINFAKLDKKLTFQSHKVLFRCVSRCEMSEAACCSHTLLHSAAQTLSKATNRYINLGAWQEIPFRWQQSVHAIRWAEVYCDEINWSQQMKARGPKQHRDAVCVWGALIQALHCHPVDWRGITRQEAMKCTELKNLYNSKSKHIDVILVYF